jgi:hypothetical protein
MTNPLIGKLPVEIEVPRKSSADWHTDNPILPAGQCGIDTTHGLTKLGDGVTAWRDLGLASATQGPWVPGLPAGSSWVPFSATPPSGPVAYPDESKFRRVGLAVEFRNGAVMWATGSPPPAGLHDILVVPAALLWDGFAPTIEAQFVGLDGTYQGRVGLAFRIADPTGNPGDAAYEAGDGVFAAATDGTLGPVAGLSGSQGWEIPDRTLPTE